MMHEYGYHPPEEKKRIFRPKLFGFLAFPALVGMAEPIVEAWQTKEQERSRERDVLLEQALAPLSASLSDDIQSRHRDRRAEEVEINGTIIDRDTAERFVNDWYTEIIKEHKVPASSLWKDCAVIGEGDQETLNAIKCDLLYGADIQLSDEAKGMLQTVSGFSDTEYRAVSDILRDSVYDTPMKVDFGFGTSIVGLIRHNEANIPNVYKADEAEIYQTYYDDAYTFLQDLLGRTDDEWEHTSAWKDQVKNVIRTSVKHEQALLTVVALASDLHAGYSEEILKEGLKDPWTEKQNLSAIQRAMNTYKDFESAMDSLLNIVPDDVRSVCISIKDARQEKLKNILFSVGAIDDRDAQFYQNIVAEL